MRRYVTASASSPSRDVTAETQRRAICLIRRVDVTRCVRCEYASSRCYAFVIHIFQFIFCYFVTILSFFDIFIDAVLLVLLLH